jgi:1-acyl-sn-glycerol-3-phosphate acyltransferase
MATRTFRYSALAIDVMAKIIGSRFSVEGLENLPNKPVMFVANHFTRFETFLIPYLIYQHTGRQVRCLADSSLYHGFFGRFLHAVGTISTADTRRDRVILKDLINAEYDWMIYPEGSMIKSKEIEKHELFINRTPYRLH